MTERRTLTLSWLTGRRKQDKAEATRYSQERGWDAYTRLITEHELALLRVAHRLCCGREDQAQDLVQDTLIKGYTAYSEGRFQEGTNARAWLVRILTNSFITEYNRKQKWEAPVDLFALTAGDSSLPAALHASPQDDPEASLLSAILDEPVEQALARLSHELRACIVLVDIEELDYAEAAAALGVPIGTVRSRLFRARQQLHSLLYAFAHDRRRTP
jgi:RNA polymerase sigma-70 factor (ECF subfamily)